MDDIDGLGDFEYQPLNRDEPSFRLLRLLRQDGTIIRCELFEAALEPGRHEPYEALSYTWGSDERVEDVIVNGRRHWITDNLYAALQNLRQRDFDRVLWIDGICIDQANNHEKSQQVRLMKDIYRQADRVVIWLGKATKEIRALTKLLRNTLLSKPGIRLDSGTVFDSRPNLRNLKQAEIGLRTLLRRPWFTRVWILQEVAFAKTTLICVGPEAVPANALAALHSIFPSLAMDHHVQSVLDIMPGHESGGSWWHDKPDLYSLLQRFRERKATDQRDMLYALLSLSSSSYDRVRIVENYDLPLDKVVQSAMDYFMELGTTRVDEILDLLTTFTSTTALLVVHGETIDGLKQALDHTHEQDRTLVKSTMRTRENMDKHFPRSRLKLIVERSGGSSREVETTCYAQVLQLLNADIKTFYEERRVGVYPAYQRVEGLDPSKLPIAVCPWEARGGNVKLLLLGENSEALAIAASHELEMVVRLILDQSDIDPRGIGCTEALVRATERGSRPIVNLLLDVGVHLNGCHEFSEQEVQKLGLFDHSRTYDGADIPVMTALGLASFRGDILLARTLLQSGADVNGLNERNSSDLDFYKRPGSALQMALAAKQPHLLMIELLLSHGADVNLGQGRLSEPIIGAARRGLDDIVKVLIDHGADLEVPERNTYGEGEPHQTAVFHAASHGRISTVRLLLSDRNSQDDPSKIRNALWGSLDGLCREGENRKSGKPCQSYAACMKVASLLIERGLEFGHSVDCDDLYAASLRAACTSGEVALVAQLLEKGTHPDQWPEYMHKFGISHNFFLEQCGSNLQAASVSGSAEIVQLLLDHGAPINKMTKAQHKTWKSWGTALCAAVEGNQAHVAEQLLQNHADPNLRGESGTALQIAFLATDRSDETLIRMLLQHGADPNPALSIFNKTVEDIQLLVEYGADVNHQSTEGEYRTALQVASASNNVAVIDELVKHGADVNLVTAAFRFTTALQAASHDRHYEAIDSLIRHGADVNLWNSGRGHPTALHATFEIDNPEWNSNPDPDFVLHLIEHGAYLDAALELGVTVRDGRYFDRIVGVLGEACPRVSQWPRFSDWYNKYRKPHQISEWPIMHELRSKARRRRKSI